MRMQAIFIRHNMYLPKGASTLKKMWDDRVIALDYDCIASTDPADYKDNAAKDALNRMKNYCQQGALVGADYRKLYNDKMLVGEIAPGSQIEIREYDGYEFYKVVKLENAKEVSYLRYPILLTLQPRLAALTGWNSVLPALQAAIHGKPLNYQVYSLDLNQLEVLCYEYLREKNLIKSLVLPIGRTLRDIDIFGISSDNKDVLAQVTFSKDTKEIEDKANRLKIFARQGNKLYFFCPADAITSGKDLPPEINFISIEDMFGSFGNGHSLIKKMLGYES